MKAWLRETHGPEFELLRHFLVRFFDSDLITAPGQTTTALIGAFSLFLPWFPLFVSPLREKYAHFSGLATPGPFREIARADELWLITLMMGAIGLLTAIQWQSLFPGLRDYQALGSLPLRPRQIFAAKLAALLLVITAALITLNALPTLSFPAVASGRWQLNPSLGQRIIVHATATGAAAYFAFFALVAFEGVLLNVLPPRIFGRVTGYVQGILVAGMLILVVLSFSIQPQVTRFALQPALARCLPPVWFLGLYQAMSGDRDAVMLALAHRAQAALLMTIGLALVSYLVSYYRHRELLVKGSGFGAKERRWTGTLLGWLMPNPRRQAAVAFMTKTLIRSSQHRMVLMGYGGLGVAILLSGLIGMRGTVHPQRMAAACFVYAHVILMSFLLIGLRHLFSIPSELKANWTFQITEFEGRSEWLRAVDWFVLTLGATVMLAIPFPLEALLLGWRALGESVLFLIFGLLCYEWAFGSWEKLPFTCSHLPGKTPMWILALKFLGLLGLLPIVSGILLLSLYNAVAYVIVLALLIGAWLQIRVTRRGGRGETRLKYEEAPDPEIHGLNLLG
jgi:hypothetical protein